METQPPHETDPYPSTSPTLLSEPVPLDFFTPIFFQHDSAHFHHPHPHQPHTISPPSTFSSQLHSPPPPIEEEPDPKRQRNTAASARFRAKKKRQEESLESSAQEKRERLQALEGRVSELEVENRWLKDLIFERGQKQKRDRGSEAGEGDGRDEDERKDGVGS